jgi:hypothetical protein
MSPVLMPKRPLIRLNSVLLPAPLGPMMATRSPCFTDRLAPRMISVLPKLLRTSTERSSDLLQFEGARASGDEAHTMLMSNRLPALDFLLDLFLHFTPLRREVRRASSNIAGAREPARRRRRTSCRRGRCSAWRP